MFHSLQYLLFFDPEGSQSATTVVVVGVVVTLSKNAKGFVNMQRIVTKLRIHIRNPIPDRSTISDF